MSVSSTTAPADNTVQQLYDAAHDIEMQDAFPVNDQSPVYVILDTNVLIDYQTVIEQFCADLEKTRYPIKIIIPSVVLGELDGLKHNPALQWFARQATTWLLKKVKERRTVKIQGARETKSGGPRAEADEVRKNDLAIRDCALYFNDRRIGLGAAMVSMDNLLCVECHRDAGGPVQHRERAEMDEDKMDIDEAAPVSLEEYEPVHARDSLHVQMAEHFVLVLRDLARRVHVDYRDSTTVTTSKHAPNGRPVCLEYLETKKRFKCEHWQPFFFAMRGHGAGRRARLVAAKVGPGTRYAGGGRRQFEDGALLSSVAAVRPHVKEVWEAKVRPL
ncbi:PIN domain-containing protein [Epithele typhae]|uniref:PIN domain-containing protein n=1 Tax=Epithele typhae TaxID=378194 RepID=UPI0020086A41|nr:PIN domain-containing protein [Epithele typhae]KAH9943493.1 PIN domain-containing protein [Epithele typhae]